VPAVTAVLMGAQTFIGLRLKYLWMLHYINTPLSLLSGPHLIPLLSVPLVLDRFLGQLYALPIEDLSIWWAP
jgi:hypothetical protein